jgi:nucleotide-binding universal stress UspA family protein
MIRSILLPIAEGAPAANARDFAFWLARREGSRIQALAIIDLKAFEIPVLGTPDGFMPSVVTPPLQESQSLLEELTALARERLAEFAGACAALNISCSTEIRTGVPAELVAQLAVAHDIVVMSRAGYTRAREKEAKIDPIVPQVIRSSIRPVLVASAKPRMNREIRNILVAFDGSLHAGRALLVAAELGARPGVQCTLMTISSLEEAGNEVLAPAEAFLYHHNVTPRKKVVIGTKASEVICEAAASTEADMLIMGAFGHSPVREMLFGSTTERVLAHCGATVVLQS